VIIHLNYLLCDKLLDFRHYFERLGVHKCAHPKGGLGARSWSLLVLGDIMARPQRVHRGWLGTSHRPPNVNPSYPVSPILLLVGIAY